MKVTQTEAKFKPVTITLESQLEVDVLVAFGGLISGSGPVRKVIDDLYVKLTPYTDAPIKPFEGNAGIKKEFENDI